MVTTLYEQMPGKWVIPFEFSDRVCSCDNPRGHLADPNGGGWLCANCHRAFRFILRTCVGCGEIFLVNGFRDEKMCVVQPRCLNCTALVQTPCDHENCRKFFGGEAHTENEYYLHKRTKAELSAALDSFGDDLIDLDSLPDFEF